MAANCKIYVLMIEDTNVDVTFPSDAFVSEAKAIEEMKDYLKRQTKPGEVHYTVENVGWIANAITPTEPRQRLRVVPTVLWK